MKRAIDDNGCVSTSIANGATKRSGSGASGRSKRKKKSKESKENEGHTGTSMTALTFQLLDLKYVPDDHHQFYFKGRTKDNHGIMGIMEGYQHYFYLERQCRFENNAQVEEFLDDIARLIGGLKKINVLNNHGVQKDKDSVYPVSTKWYCKYAIRDDANDELTLDEGMSDFYTGFELINDRHQTMAHYMPDDVFIQVVKVYVKYPYQAKVMSQFFESTEYANYIGARGRGKDEVRTFCATFDPALDAIVDNDIKMGSWCTVNKYNHLVGNNRIGYNHYNITCRFQDVVSDKLNIDPCNLRILSFDGEMPGKPGRFPRALNEPTSTIDRQSTTTTTTTTTITTANDAAKRPTLASLAGEANEVDPQDTDPIVIIGAVVKEMNVHGGMSFEKAVVFVYECPDAEPIMSVDEWLTLKRKKDPTFQSMWQFDKVEFRRFTSEVDMIFAFQDFIHASDLDVLTGHNIDRFDLPYLLNRLRFHSKWGELQGMLVNPKSKCMTFDIDGTYRTFNLGCLTKGYSKLSDDYKAKQKGIISHRVNTDFYVLADTYNIWINDGMEKPTNYTLNVVAMENLLYPDNHVEESYERVKKAYNIGSDAGASKPSAPDVRLFSNLQYDDLTLLGARSVDSLRSELKNARDKERDKEKRAKMGFEMKKIDFEHDMGLVYWHNGGLDMLHFSLYCIIDCILPVSMLQKKSKLTANLLFTSMTGVGMLDIFSTGQHRLVTSQIYTLYKKRNNGTKLPYDRGNRHAHWPGVFDHECGIEAGILRNGERLEIYRGEGPQNQGGAVQDPAMFGVTNDTVVTVDAGSEYPSEIECQGLSPCSFLTTHLINKYKVPRHHYAVKYVGDANLNWCGERVTNQLEANILGCENPDLKVTYWHQKMEPALGELVRESFANRNAGKKAKSAWMSLLNTLNAMDQNGKSEFQTLLCDIRDARKRQHPTGHTDGRLKDFILNSPKIAYLFKDVATNKRSSDLLRSMVEKINGVTNLSELENLCLFQWDNAENYQLAVKRSMNSLYGVLMMVDSIFSCPEIAATVTSCGRGDIARVRFITERLTSTLSKRHMGYVGEESSPDKTLPPIGEDDDVYAGFLRFLPNETLSLMKEVFRSFESFIAIYGDTDSVMCKSLLTSVVNKKQAFAVMNHLCIVINGRMFGMLLFNAEKISLITILYSAKIYDMKVFLSDSDDCPVKWWFSGFGKSDTIPFVTETLYECKQIILNGLDEGYTINEVITRVCEKITHSCTMFIMGRVPVAKLCMTKQLHKMVYAGAIPHHAQVATNITKRGGTVNIKDYITYTFVKSNSANDVYVPEDLNYINALPNPQGVLNLKQIWESCIINKFKIFLRNLVAPVVDYPRIDPTAQKEIVTLQKRNQVAMKAIQDNYIASGLFNLDDGITARLDKRDKEEKKEANFGRFCKHIESECTLCFRFYKREARKHLVLAYEEAKESTKTPHTKPSTRTSPKGSESNLCPDCRKTILDDKDDPKGKLKHLIDDYKKDATEYVKCWTKCLVCVELGETPNPGPITSCKAIHCSNYKRKANLKMELENNERLLIDLAGFNGIDWNEII